MPPLFDPALAALPAALAGEFELEHERGATEVTVFADLRPGHDVNVWAYGVLSGGDVASF